MAEQQQQQQQQPEAQQAHAVQQQDSLATTAKMETAREMDDEDVDAVAVQVGEDDADGENGETRGAQKDAQTAKSTTAFEQDKNMQPTTREYPESSGSGTPRRHDLGRMAHNAGKVLPAWAISAGVNFEADSTDEVHHTVNCLLYARIAQFLLSLIAWACAAAAISHFNSLMGRGDTGPFISGIVWDLVLMLLVWIYVVLTAVLGFLVLGQKFASSGRAKLFSWSVAVGDVLLVFLTFSAFAAAASSTQVLSGFSDLYGGESFGSGKAGAAAAFTFFTWMVFLYSACLSMAVLKGARFLDPSGYTADHSFQTRTTSTPRGNSTEMERTVAQV